MYLDDTNQTTCFYGCGKIATHHTKNGKSVCSKRPAGCSVIRDRMKSTTLERFGVENASSSKQIKSKRKETMLERYGVTNANDVPGVKETQSKKAVKRWSELRHNKEYTKDGLTRIQYRHRCQQYANTQYIKFKDVLDPANLRGAEYHLDHIYSVDDGFINDIPFNVLSDVSNLRVIYYKDNYKKHRKSEKSLEQLYEDYLRSSNHLPS